MDDAYTFITNNGDRFFCTQADDPVSPVCVEPRKNNADRRLVTVLMPLGLFELLQEESTIQKTTLNALICGILEDTF